MPGVAANSEGTGVPQTQTPVPVPVVPNYPRPMPSASVPKPIPDPPTQSSCIVAPPASSTPAGRPRPPNLPAHTPTQAPAKPAPASQYPSRASPPPRPLVEPLTPPLNPVQFPPVRQTYAHSSHPPQAATIAPSPSEPIEFEENPDVLALKSAISILQMQSARAKRDMVALKKAKDAALEEPEAFIADLQGGKVHVGIGGDGGSNGHTSSDDDDNEDDVRPEKFAIVKENFVKSDPDTMDIDMPTSREPKPWSTLPKGQNVVRCPPINWGQYAVVGESLDRLHNEQLARPTEGTPATILPDGRYEPGGVGKRENLLGIAAPYNPLKDKLEKKKPKVLPRQG